MQRGLLGVFTIHGLMSFDMHQMNIELNVHPTTPPLEGGLILSYSNPAAQIQFSQINVKYSGVHILTLYVLSSNDD